MVDGNDGYSEQRRGIMPLYREGKVLLSGGMVIQAINLSHKSTEALYTAHTETDELQGDGADVMLHNAGCKLF